MLLPIYNLWIESRVTPNLLDLNQDIWLTSNSRKKYLKYTSKGIYL